MKLTESQRDILSIEARAECKAAMKELLGYGYVDDYYESAASDFVDVAVWTAEYAMNTWGPPEPKEKKELVNSTTTYINKTIFTCPACGKEVTGRISIEIEVGDVSFSGAGSEVTMGASNVRGVAVSHDCIPKVTR